MRDVAIPYTQPREKLQQKGAPALSNAELLQILIGSGNARVGVARIAKRTLRVLVQRGSEVSFEQLLTVSGLGPATVCQIMAAFELASRYPMTARQLTIDTDEKILGLVGELRTGKAPRLMYITVDGARRLIAKRSVLVHAEHPSALLRKVFADAMSDNAAGLIVVVGAKVYSLESEMFDLSLARDLRAMARLFMMTVHDHLLISEQGQRSLKGESW